MMPLHEIKLGLTVTCTPITEMEVEEVRAGLKGLDHLWSRIDNR